MTRAVRWRAALAALVLTVALAPADAQGPRPSDAPAAGQLLVATEALQDPRFARTVVYLARHDDDGTLGLIVNRPLADVALREVLERLGLDARRAEGALRVHYGGPVQRQHFLVLHSPEYRTESTRPAGPLALTMDPAVLQAMAEGRGPRRSLFALGHAGWAPGQLQHEIEDGYWFTVPADDALVFDADAATKWDRARARRKLNI